MYEGDATQSYNRTYVCSVLRQTSSRRPRETVKLMVLGSWSCPSKVNGTIKYSEAKFIVICKKKVKLPTLETGLLSLLKQTYIILLKTQRSMIEMKEVFEGEIFHSHTSR